jgi:hypothetical protein
LIALGKDAGETLDFSLIAHDVGITLPLDARHSAFEVGLIGSSPWR